MKLDAIAGGGLEGIQTGATAAERCGFDGLMPPEVARDPFLPWGLRPGPPALIDGRKTSRCLHAQSDCRSPLPHPTSTAAVSSSIASISASMPMRRAEILDRLRSCAI